MKSLPKLALILVVFSILLLVISACQQSDRNAPGEDIDSNVSNEDEVVSEDNSKQASNDNSKGDSNSNDNPNSDGNYEKLDINPQVSIKENMDYIKIDEPSVDFELKDLKGDVVKLSDYKGQLVFLNFWATWCPPCREEMPDMESIHKEYGDKGVVILGVSSTELELRGGSDKDKAQKQVKDYIDREGFTFSIPLDFDNKVLMEYNSIYPVIGIPTTFLIDREGIIRYARPGPFQGEEQLKAFIALLDE